MARIMCSFSLVNNTLIRDNSITDSQFRLLIVIRSYAWPDKYECQEKYSVFESDTGWSRRKVEDKMKELKILKLIQVKKGQRANTIKILKTDLFESRHAATGESEVLDAQTTEGQNNSETQILSSRPTKLGGSLLNINNKNNKEDINNTIRNSFNIEMVSEELVKRYLEFKEKWPAGWNTKEVRIRAKLNCIKRLDTGFSVSRIIKIMDFAFEDYRNGHYTNPLKVSNFFSPEMEKLEMFEDKMERKDPIKRNADKEPFISKAKRRLDKS